MSVTASPFGVTQQGEPVTAYTLTNAAGMRVVVLNYGGVIQSLFVPDRAGEPVDIVLGYDTVAGYEHGNCFYGAFVGRYGNRIGGSRFPLDGGEVVLTPNENGNHLHGVFPFHVHDVTVGENSVTLRRVSPDGEDGFPGNLTVAVTYTLTEENGLVLDYRAETDRTTVLNLTNHSYFNLSGQHSGDILNTVLQLNASAMTPTDRESIPTGEVRSVEGTVFDFTVPKPIGRDIEADDEQLRFAGGYDHNFVLDLPGLDTPAATAYSPLTGILMDVYTTQPGVQFYAGNSIPGDPVGVGKGGVRNPYRGGFCLETQHFPDTPNHPNFPSAELRPGEVYHQVTEFRFSLAEE